MSTFFASTKRTLAGWQVRCGRTRAIARFATRFVDVRTGLALGMLPKLDKPLVANETADLAVRDCPASIEFPVGDLQVRRALATDGFAHRQGGVLPTGAHGSFTRERVAFRTGEGAYVAALHQRAGAVGPAYHGLGRGAATAVAKAGTLDEGGELGHLLVAEL